MKTLIVSALLAAGLVATGCQSSMSNSSTPFCMILS